MKNFWNFLRVSFNLRPKNLVIYLFTLALLSTSVGCKKEMNTIGLNLNEDILYASFTDTATVTAYSILHDSLKTASLVFNFLGFLNDNVFGTTTASIYTQFVPSGNNISFGDSPELDSIVLTLRYTGGFYGDTLNPFLIKIYELEEEMSVKDTFYSFSSVPHNGIDLIHSDYAPFSLYPTPKTKVKLDTVYEPHIRIRLSDELGYRFLRNEEELATASSFISFFKGLYICSEQLRSNGSLVNFTLQNAGLSGIQLYYKNKGETKKFSFVIKGGSETVRFSEYKHEYELGRHDFVEQVINNVTSGGSEKIFVQAMGGVKTKITFPHLKSLKDKRIVINKAELVLSVDKTEELTLYPPPSNLGLQAKNMKGDLVFVPDELWGGGYFGGNYNSDKKEYRFRITRYVQDMILRNNYEPYLYLVASGAAAFANRVVLYGHEPQNLMDKSSRLRLEIYYTEY